MDEAPELTELRSHLTDRGFDVGDLADDPMVQLERWLDEAWAAGLHNANSMALATASAGGLPSVRNVLWRGVHDGGLVFHTNRESRKGVDLAANPRAEALFSWLALERQVRTSGPVTVAPDRVSDDYWRTRPRGSQIAAVTSPQSRPVADRASLEAHRADVEAAHEGRDVPRPSHWGGFVLTPERWEFWQGRAFRLHDRLVYERDDDGWRIIRLAP